MRKFLQSLLHSEKLTQKKSWLWFIGLYLSSVITVIVIVSLLRALVGYFYS